MKDELNYIVKRLIEVRAETELEGLDDNTLFDCAVRILNSGFVKEKQSPQKQTNKPTEKQINFLKKVEYNGDFDTLTFEEAKQLISEYIQREHNKT